MRCGVQQFVKAAWFAVAFLSGCERMGGELSAGNSEPQELMQLLMPGWKAGSPASLRKIALPTEKGKPAETDIYTLAPGLVVKLADDKVVLIVVGAPAHETGISRAGHATPALLSAYWFERRDGRWFKKAEQIAFAEEGFFGEPGELKQIDLGGGKTALAIENGSCWQGACGRWLALYGVGEARIDRMFGELISSDNENARDNCSALMEMPVGRQERVPLDAYSSMTGCYRIVGQWKTVAGPAGPGQLLIDYRGKQSRGEVVPVLAAPEADAISNGDEIDSPMEEYLVTVHEVRQNQTYRFVAGKFELVEGKNPNPGL